MRRKLKLAALLLLVAALLSGCMDFSSMMDVEMDPDATPAPTLAPLDAPVYTDREALYEWYNEVNIGDMLTDLTEKYGEPRTEETENGITYIWQNEAGYGFAAVFYENGRLRAKVLHYEDLRQMKQLSAATHVSNVTSLSKEYDFSMVCSVLGGKPMEIAAISQDSSVNPDVKRLFAWVAEDESSAQVLFSSKEKVESVSYNLTESEAEG